MVTLNNQSDACPCGSGAVIKDCCLQFDGSLRPKAFVPKLAPLNSGSAHAKCYASQLGNCCSTISSEHYISRGLLEQVAINGVIPSIAGLSWLDDGETALSVNAMTSNILCKRHNEALSGFDAVGAHLFSQINHMRQEEPRTNKVQLFNGHDIERWLLKTLCALVFSGNACSAVTPTSSWKPNPFWLSVLFLNEALPVNWGLYWSARVGGRNNFAYNVLSNGTDGVYGLIAIFNGMQLLLAMAHPRPGEGDLLNNCIYRPSQIIFRGTDAESVLMFGWDVAARGKQLTFAVSKLPSTTK